MKIIKFNWQLGEENDLQASDFLKEKKICKKRKIVGFFPAQITHLNFKTRRNKKN
jgi:hypothetical protein